MTATMVLTPAPIQHYLDNSGNPLVGGQLFLYAAGTTTPQAAYTDSSGATPLSNPVVLNVRGEVAPSANGTSCGLWLDPTLSYKLVLAPAGDTNPPSNPIWTIDNVVSPQSAILALLNQYMASIAGVPIGGQIPFGGATPPVGFLLCNGAAVSRTVYAALFAVIGTSYGNGDGSTTFNLPDKRGRTSIGADNMGGSAAGNVTNAVSGINSTVVGSKGGSQYAQQDSLSVTASASATSTVNDPGHKHWQFYTGTFPGHGVPEGGVSNATGPGAQSPDMQTAMATTGITVTTTVTPTVTVTSTLTGASQNMSPCEVDNWIIYTGVSS